jgi:hypothetical protein
MSEVSFDEDTSLMRPVRARFDKPSTGLSAWLMSKGIAKTSAQANATLLLFALGLIVLAWFLFVKTAPKPYEPTPQERAVFERMQGRHTNAP